VGLGGDETVVDLRLKLLADAALVGFPNAGKSSLLRRISNAKPKVAEYPFTTIAPVLGTVESPDGRQLTVADVPGLLEGAHQGVGLGDEFLAHLERARLLVHVIEGQEEDAEARFATIDGELRSYGAGLDERPQIVVLNKADLGRAKFELDDPRILAVVETSAATGEGVEELKRLLFHRVPESAPAPAETEEELADFLVYRPAPPRGRPFRIFRTDRGYRVRGEASEEALRGAGVKPGDEVEYE
jgi:GTP-binding protein